MSSLRVVSYSISTLAEAIAKAFNPPQTTLATVQSKDHLHYFETYFGSSESHAATIVIEEPYTDRDFLEDYAAYYVKCLDKYRSRCCRLHFFSIAFTQQHFDDLLRGQPSGLTEDQFCSRENYLGFVVIRPLPQTFVGRTCLRTYSGDGGRRHYPVTRDYDVHLAGFSLKVRSLAFQEQDRATSACATSALWSTFHGTGMLFHHSIFSPVEITRHAVKRVPGCGRSFPNNGLTVLQMASAINEIGLEPDILDVSREELLQGMSYAYLKAGIPLLLVVSLYDASDPNNVKHYDENEPDIGHAVAVTGFSLGRPQVVPHPKHGTLFQHSRIDKLYVHDDQIGPFARVSFDGPLFRVSAGGPRRVSHVSLVTSWTKAGQVGSIRFVPESVIVPLYHKIRISYLTILADVIATDKGLFEVLRAAMPHLLPERMEWDVFLTTGDMVKESMRKSLELVPEDRLRHVQDQYPRFVWRATGTCAGRRRIDMLYDATDIETGNFLMGGIVYDELLRAALGVPNP